MLIPAKRSLPAEGGGVDEGPEGVEEGLEGVTLVGGVVGVAPGMHWK